MPTEVSKKTDLEAGLNDEAKCLLKAELARRNISHQDLANRLSAAGLATTKASVDCKLSRGSFGAGFFLKCLKVIGCESLPICDLK
ncbi:DUF6471 domain-containing protein [Geomonas limicola]|uniref:DUF6471 domain-containing protein n=1 Tax=Geomonas limicola TaxID=2740186 RepID=UPI00161E6BB5|nr:DUF6471 domain-containing protein [Geomonas limicola]